MRIFRDGCPTEIIMIVAAIVAAIVVWQVIREPRAAILILCGVAIAGPLQAVRLYWQNDSMMGGLPKANYSYTSGLVILASGNITTCYGFMIEDAGIIYLGSFLLLGGIGTLVGASTLLFKHIIRRGLRSNPA